MSVDLEPDREALVGAAKLPHRPEAAGADAARQRLMARVVGGGLQPGPSRARDRIGPYRLAHELGRGGMGEVWEATRDDDPTPVAIKILRAAVAAHDPTRRRFLREARTAAAVRHPHVVHILDVGTTDEGTPYLVMERLQGRPLEAWLRDEGALPWPAARTILLQIAEALAFAHSRGVVHRDLKPANVMVAGSLDAPHCTIIDFGLARREVIASGSESLSRTGEVFGSPPFMSPEQFRGDTADARSDQYSFGCLMYQAVTGRRPFGGDKVGELMYQHLFEPAPEPTALRVDDRIAPAVSAVILRALRKAPEHRFASMDDLVVALHRIDDDPRPVAVPDEAVVEGGRVVASSPASPRGWLPWAVAAVAVVAGGIAVLRVPDPAREPTRAPSSTPTAATTATTRGATDASAVGAHPVDPAGPDASLPSSRVAVPTGPAVADPPGGGPAMDDAAETTAGPGAAAATEPPSPTHTDPPEPPRTTDRRRPRRPRDAAPASNPATTDDPAPSPPTSELPPNPFRAAAGGAPHDPR